MLLKNLSIYADTLVRSTGPGTLYSTARTSLIDRRIGLGSFRTDTWINRFVSEADFSTLNSVPSGYVFEDAIAPALGVGQLSSVIDLGGAGTVTASLNYVDNRRSMRAAIRANECTLVPADVADAVWNEALPGSYTGSEAGKIVGSKLLTWLKFLALK